MGESLKRLLIDQTALLKAFKTIGLTIERLPWFNSRARCLIHWKKQISNITEAIFLDLVIAPPRLNGCHYRWVDNSNHLGEVNHADTEGLCTGSKMAVELHQGFQFKKHLNGDLLLILGSHRIAEFLTWQVKETAQNIAHYRARIPVECKTL